VLIALTPRTVDAQGRQGSGTPWSAYGLGDMLGSTQVSQALMGGTGVALADPFSVVRINPASYAGLSKPCFETGLMGGFLGFETARGRRQGGRLDLLGFSIGVPFGNSRWGLALGLNPLSDVNYLISETSSQDAGDVTFEYSGDGGLNRAFIGIGHTIWQRRDSLGQGGGLSIGTNIDYLFGRVDEVRKAYYPRNTAYYNNSIVSSLVLRSPSAGVGIQYADNLIGDAAAKARAQRRRERLRALDLRREEAWAAKGKAPAERKVQHRTIRDGEALRFRLGVSMEMPANVGARHTELASTFVSGNSGVEFPVDTSRYVDGAKGRVGIPPQYAFGIALQNSRWTVTAEHRLRDWRRFSIDVEGREELPPLGTAASYALGGAFRPAGSGQGSFFQNTIYRAGLRYVDDYLMVNEQQLRQIGMSFGFSLPIMGSTTRSRLSIGAEVGERGPKGEGLVRERFTYVYMGITITPDLREQWFKKRRID